LQTRFREVVGEISKSPNRKFLVRRIQETLAAQAEREAEHAGVGESAAQEPATEAQPEPVVEVKPAEETAPAATEPTAEAPEADEAEPELPAGYEPPQDEQGGAEVANTTTAKRRGRFAGMSVPELQAEYLRVVGRPTSSDNAPYLQWKIREAEKGNVP